MSQPIPSGVKDPVTKLRVYTVINPPQRRKTVPTSQEPRRSNTIPKKAPFSGESAKNNLSRNLFMINSFLIKMIISCNTILHKQEICKGGVKKIGAGSIPPPAPIVLGAFPLPGKLFRFAAGSDSLPDSGFSFALFHQPVESVG